jgi:hypothetical protein
MAAGAAALTTKTRETDMVAIPFPLSSSPGIRPHTSAGRLINAYHEPLAAGARSANVWCRAPGLKNWAVSGQSGNRGQIVVGATLYAAFADNVTRFDPSGIPTVVGNLPGAERVFWARNNRAPTPDLVVVDIDNGARVVTASDVLDYPDANLPQPNSVCFLDGYFFFTIGDGRCFASDINATSVDANNFITCEGKPDSLIRAVAFGDLYLCGTDSIEVWHDTAEPTGFPFSRVQVIPRGIIGPYAISGFEDGIGKGLVFVADDKCVYALNGYSPVKVSTPDVDRAIARFVQTNDPAGIEMFPYVVGGHSCVAVRSSEWTWVLDLDTTHWHERTSYNRNTWRATSACKAFGKWLAGDDESGDILEITDAVADETGHPLIWQVESGPVSAFPNRASVMEATFDLAEGVGIAAGADPMQTDPRVEIQWSDDGGISWSVPLIRRLGRQSQVAGPIKVCKTGLTGNQGRRWRLTVSDAVDVELTGADMSVEVRAG